MSIFEPPGQFRSLTPFDDFMQKAKYFTEKKFKQRSHMQLGIL